jgi:pyruvate dehydrogenase E1 component
VADRPADLPTSSISRSDVAILESIADRVLWLATRMIHEANNVRPNLDGLKVGGHQASSASVASILTALYFWWLEPADLVSVKPHASPAYHAIQYLLGDLDVEALRSVRRFGGLQAYPSRTKDPDRVDFSTGSVGLGAVAPLYAALADRYLRLHRPERTRGWPARRFVAIVGDAELDEGSVWESVIEDALRGIDNVTVIVDLNRQSLDRVIPNIRSRKLEALFRAADWQVLEVKYGRRLRQLFDRKAGSAIRTCIDEMSNEEYQVVIRADGAAVRSRLIEGTPPRTRAAAAAALASFSDDALVAAVSDLGGHDIADLVDVLARTSASEDRPSVIFAYTIKGWKLPFAGDSMNHSAALSTAQMESLARHLGADPDRPWDRFDSASPEGRWCDERGRRLLTPRKSRISTTARMGWTAPAPEVRVAAHSSTQQAFGDTLVAISKQTEVVDDFVTASPDVAVSTSLGGWVNRVGVFALREAPVVDATPRPLTWSPRPTGQHVELGISEMNLFMWLSQFGLTAELFGEALIPIGTVYDPFICRGLDALIYALYVQSRFILVGTPSGIALAPEGGAHQSIITPSIGMELPGIRAYEPVFGAEVAWLTHEACRGVMASSAGFSTYLRLSTRAIDQSLAEPARVRLGDAKWRQDVLAGGYRLIEATDEPKLPAGSPVVNIVAMGAVVPEAVVAVRRLIAEEVAANLIVVTSPDRLSAEMHDRHLSSIRTGVETATGHLERLFPPEHRRAPIVTALDGASHTLSFIGGAFGAPVIPLGVDSFGQSGSIDDLFGVSGIDSDHIVEAGLRAADLWVQG